MRSSIRKNRGFTLLELMVGLIIAAIIVAIAAAAVGRVFAANETTTEARNINELMSNAQGLKGPDGYSTLSLPMLASVAGIPTSLKNSKTGTAVVNSWDGAVALRGNVGAFTLSYAGVPKAACITLATRVAEAGAWAVHTGATAITTSAQAQTACASETTNTLLFTYNATAPVS